jgi:hypothetical protein
VKTIDYTLHLDKEVFDQVQREAQRRKMKLDEAFRVTIAYGLPGLTSELGREAVIADTWEKLGPAPDIDYRKL